MKKLLVPLFFISLVSLVNCGPFSTNINLAPVSEVTNQVSVGMHVDEFLKIAGNRAQKELIFARNYYVYRVEQIQISTTSRTKIQKDIKFFYFDYNYNSLLYVKDGAKSIKQ